MPNIKANKILDYLNSSIICLSDNLTINQVNATAEVFFDSSEKTLLNKPFASLFDPNAENTILKSLEFCLHNNHQTTEHEALLMLVNHRLITTDYSIHPIMEAGQINLLVEIQPIDRHMEIARDGQRINQQIASQQLARGMAHEIKNPLGGIRGAAQLLEGEITNPALKEYTDVIIREVDRLQTLLNDMLGPNRKIVKTNMNILEVLEHVRSLILAEFPDSQVIRDYDPSIPEILADKDQLIQAFLNLARNAAQAFVPLGANQTSKIIFKTRICRQHTIGHRRYRHVMQIDIIDNGPGVADEVIDNIFLPMVTNKPDGSGLGLPIAQQIIFGHNGIIQCQSDQDKTVFTTLLPLEPAT
ncbi:MAG: PAS domain-containing sensor histidine kinase [Gammaproteobacteria bacterium]|nr:PAS domain-containing sensor histidine kinase [Gammaproteobacteria bacterium]